ncbi:DUF4143 domain-containing protein [Nocardia sp. 2]|uniref:DUF4143 domain-containing protein n=1 Tax=Nocardia acididurans TaxID=2802282 RepID=A0ABS1M499_9NOCA|nr:DUF4143 domain-containing protein [Nocardia acididurans]
MRALLNWSQPAPDNCSRTPLSSDLALGAPTVKRYLALLEEVYLIKRIPAWSRNPSNRATMIPKVAFVDSGLAANLVGADVRNMLRPNGRFGPLLERFVLMELARQRTWSAEDVEMYHTAPRTGSRSTPSSRTDAAMSSASKSKPPPRCAPTTSATSPNAWERFPHRHRAPHRPALPVSALWEVPNPER